MLSRLFGLLTALALLAGVACSASEAPARPSPPPAASDAGTIPGAGGTVVAGAFKPVFDAFWTLRLKYHRELDDGRLLAAAWRGAKEAAEEADVALPPGLAPAWGRGSVADDERALALALEQVALVAGSRLPREALVRAAIEEMAAEPGDNHTYFLRPPAWRRFQTGETVGFGYSSVRRADGLLVWHVLPGHPAARAGIVPGDVIVAIDGVPVEEVEGRREFLQAGRTVVLSVQRPRTGWLSLAATPEQFPRPVLEGRMIGTVAYFRLFRFPGPGQMPPGQTFSALLDEALRALREQSPSGWVLDLRNNPGGSEATAAFVAGRFGFAGALIENRGRAGTSKVISSGESGIGGGAALVVLINENSSSSAEIVAAALQDAGLAYVIGGKSGGVVNTSRASEVAGGGLFVTTERIFAGPAQRYLDGIGVFPDRAVSMNQADLAAGLDPQLEAAVAHVRALQAAAGGAR